MALASDQADMMLTMVATALGAEILEQIAFVGGCTTALHITDELSLQGVRFTDDVDVIIDVVGRAHWHDFQTDLRARGFSESINDSVICRMRLGELKVDFRPDDESILGFSNRWYQPALRSANDVLLNNGTKIRVVSPLFFVATKLEAYLGRGRGDPIGSHDIEDIVTVFDGRSQLVEELGAADHELSNYISRQFQQLLAIPDFEYAVQSAAQNDRSREELIFSRLRAVAEGPAHGEKTID